MRKEHRRRIPKGRRIDEPIYSVMCVGLFVNMQVKRDQNKRRNADTSISGTVERAFCTFDDKEKEVRNKIVEGAYNG